MALMEVNEATFADNVREQGVTLVDFGATWCPPCKVLLPMLDELAESYGERVTMVKVDTDESPEIASRFGVMANPTVIVFRDGQPVDKLVGLRPKEVYRNAIDRHL